MKTGKQNSRCTKISFIYYLLSVVLIQCSYSNMVYAQQYPFWFLKQGKAGIPNTVVGYAERAYVSDSTAFSEAKENAALNLALQEKDFVKGDQSFWSTALGNAWMGSDIAETIDSSLIKDNLSTMSVVDSCVLSKYVLVLVSTNNIHLPGDVRIPLDIKKIPIPDWINKIPEENGFIYTVGIAEKYFYEQNSWLSAERNARLSLARTFNYRIVSLQKKEDQDFQDIKNERVSLELHSIEIVARWQDIKTGLYYVLARAPVSGFRIK